MFDRIICVLEKIKLRGHLVMSIMQFMHLISVSVKGIVFILNLVCSAFEWPQGRARFDIFLKLPQMQTGQLERGSPTWSAEDLFQ